MFIIAMLSFKSPNRGAYVEIAFKYIVQTYLNGYA